MSYHNAMIQMSAKKIVMKYLYVYFLGVIIYLLYIFTPNSNIIAASLILIFLSYPFWNQLSEEWENLKDKLGEK